jgi:hypothetical protein
MTLRNHSWTMTPHGFKQEIIVIELPETLALRKTSVIPFQTDLFCRDFCFVAFCFRPVSTQHFRPVIRLCGVGEAAILQRVPGESFLLCLL